MKNSIIYILISFFIISCSTDSIEPSDTNSENQEEPEVTNLYFPPLQTATWETMSIVEAGWNSSAEEPLRDF